MFDILSKPEEKKSRGGYDPPIPGSGGEKCMCSTEDCADCTNAGHATMSLNAAENPEDKANN